MDYLLRGEWSTALQKQVGQRQRGEVGGGGDCPAKIPPRRNRSTGGCRQSRLGEIRARGGCPPRARFVGRSPPHRPGCLAADGGGHRDLTAFGSRVSAADGAESQG